MMLRQIYEHLVQMHPAAFEQRFGSEMLECFDGAGELKTQLRLIVDGFLSLIRQWVLRPEFHRPPATAVSACNGASGVPLFHAIDTGQPRPATIITGVVVTAIMFTVAVGLIESSRTRVFGPPFRVQWGDPYQAAKLYFKAIRVLSALDADHTGIISRWEIDGAPAALRGLDADHDGSLNAEECGFISRPYAGTAPQSARQKFMRANPVLAVLDSDHDGTISASEIEHSAIALRTLDHGGKSFLTPDDVTPDDAATLATVIMMTLDTDGDRVISRAEQTTPDAEPLRELLQSADRNRGGRITEKELLRELDSRRVRGFYF